MNQTIATTLYLELQRPLYEATKQPRGNFFVRRVVATAPTICRVMYKQVGGAWGWKKRRRWTDNDWSLHLDRPEIEFWVACLGVNPVGYFETETRGDLGVEITYLGLTGEFIGKGLGAWLLAAAIEKAWARTEHRVWLKTSSSDHPNALSNYLRRGFKLFDRKQTNSLERGDSK